MWKVTWVVADDFQVKTNSLYGLRPCWWMADVHQPGRHIPQGIDRDTWAFLKPVVNAEHMHRVWWVHTLPRRATRANKPANKAVAWGGIGTEMLSPLKTPPHSLQDQRRAPGRRGLAWAPIEEGVRCPAPPSACWASPFTRTVAVLSRPLLGGLHMKAVPLSSTPVTRASGGTHPMDSHTPGRPGGKTSPAVSSGSVGFIAKIQYANP